MKIKLKTAMVFTDGKSLVAGDVIRVRAKLGERLIKSQQAELIVVKKRKDER